MSELSRNEEFLENEPTMTRFYQDLVTSVFDCVPGGALPVQLTEPEARSFRRAFTLYNTRCIDPCFVDIRRGQTDLKTGYAPTEACVVRFDDLGNSEVIQIRQNGDYRLTRFCRLSEGRYDRQTQDLMGPNEILNRYYRNGKLSLKPLDDDSYLSKDMVKKQNEAWYMSNDCSAIKTIESTEVEYALQHKFTAFAFRSMNRRIKKHNKGRPPIPAETIESPYKDIRSSGGYQE